MVINISCWSALAATLDEMVALICSSLLILSERFSDRRPGSVSSSFQLVIWPYEDSSAMRRRRMMPHQ